MYGSWSFGRVPGKARVLRYEGWGTAAGSVCRPASTHRTIPPIRSIVKLPRSEPVLPTASIAWVMGAQDLITGQQGVDLLCDDSGRRLSSCPPGTGPASLTAPLSGFPFVLFRFSAVVRFGHFTSYRRSPTPFRGTAMTCTWNATFRLTGALPPPLNLKTQGQENTPENQRGIAGSHTRTVADSPPDTPKRNES